MSKGGKVSTILINAAIFIMMEVAAVAMLRSSSTIQNIWLNRISHRTAAALWGVGENVRSYFSARKLNDELAAENARLKDRLRTLEDNRAGSETAAVRHRDGFRYIPATVVKVGRGTAHNYIILDKGSEDGIRPQSGIITDKGIVGVVSAVDKHFSYGLTLINANLSVSVRIGGGADGVTAPLKWDGKSRGGAVVGDIPPHYQINPGDTVRTSGYSAIFPADIPVGITGETRLIDGSSQQADVRLLQDFSSLRYVTVTDNDNKDEIMALESKDKNK